MDAQLLPPNELIRPWRRATLVASTIAALELVLLVGAGAFLLAKPLSHLIRSHAKAVATQPTHAKPATVKPAIRPRTAPLGKPRPRGHVKVMVFNGNGQAGAAGSAASKLHGLGYAIAGTANARRQDYATTVVMYQPGFRAEGLRLAHDLGVKVVGPMDGLHTRALDGGELAVIVGA